MMTIMQLQSSLGLIRAALEPLVAEVKELLKDKPKSPAVIMRTAHTLDSTLKRYVSGVGVFTRWQAFAYMFRDTFELYGNKLRLREDDDEEEGDLDTPNLVKLTHAETCAMLRMTYAMCYYSAQGSTIRDRHVVLFDSVNRFFTMRHLNVGMSRATHGSNVHVLTKEQEDNLMNYACVY